MKFKTLDLHEVRHRDVEEVICKFLNWTPPPCRIITGNSEEMRKIAKKKIKEYGFICYSESAYNHGSLIVVEDFVSDFE
jgi:hypothetical protein